MIRRVLQFRRKLFSTLSDEFACESRELYPSTQVRTIDAVVPANYIPMLKTTLCALEENHPQAYALVLREIRAIYAHPKPTGIGYHAHSAFISDQIQAQHEYVWVELAGYLAAMAELSLASEEMRMTFRWSRARRDADELERQVVQQLSAK